jgi:hypothetical protein
VRFGASSGASCWLPSSAWSVCWPGPHGAAGIKGLPNIGTTSGARVHNYNCSTRFGSHTAWHNKPWQEWLRRDGVYPEGYESLASRLRFRSEDEVVLSSWSTLVKGFGSCGVCRARKTPRGTNPLTRFRPVVQLFLKTEWPCLFSPQNFLYSCGRGILELHLRVIRYNTCSSIIVSTHHSENVQLIT